MSMKIRIVTLTLLLTALAVPSNASDDAVKAYEGTISMPTYLLRPAEKAPVFERDYAYQRARRSVYPYPLNDNLTQERRDSVYKCLYLENEYVKLCIIPQLGGRLMWAVDKTNGYDIFYRNTVVKPGNVGMTGAWISGGVEWNTFHHHRQTSFTPCDYRITESPDGSKTIWVGETEYRQRMQWAIGVSLHPGKSYIEVTGRLMNGTPNDNSTLYWANVSTHADESYQVCFPQQTEFVTYHAKNSFAHWPVTHEVYNGMDIYRRGIDASWWKNHYMGNSMFVYDQKEDFIGGYDHGKDAGTMLVGNHNIVKGGKFWLWGPNSEWDTKILTDTSGHYVELMVGAYSDNQPDYNWNYPYEAKEFSHYWYGIRNIGGVRAGNRHAALNVQLLSPGKATIGVNATEKMSNLKAILFNGDRILYEGVIDSIDPASPYCKEVTIDPAYKEEDLSMRLEDSEGNVLLSFTPAIKDPNAPLPPIVEKPKRPKDIASTEECYLVGLRNLQFHNPFINPTDYFLEVLRRDPGDTRANTQMGVWYRERGEYDKAASYLRTALQRLTKDYTRPRDVEAIYNLGLILKAQGKYAEAMDTLYRATWSYTYNSAANLQLAQIYASDGNWEMALDRLDEGIAYNGRNFQAKNLKGLILKKLGHTEDAKELFEAVLSEDPLDAMALRETSSEEDFHNFMREQPESYIELALLYLHDGFHDEAVTLLKDIDSRVDYPTVKMYLGFLSESEEDKAKYYSEAIGLDTGYCAPFRLETIPVLQDVSTLYPESWKPHYYLGNLLYNLQPDNAIIEWKKCTALNSNCDLAWRNLGWAYWLHTKDLEAAVDCYHKAIELNPTPLYLEECDQAMADLGTAVSERYEMLKSHHPIAEKRYYPLSQEVVLGTYMGDYSYVQSLLDTCWFPTREGVANFHDNFIDACVLYGNRKLSEGNPQAAKALYLKAFTYPQNHQVFLVDGRNTRDAMTNYDLGLAYEALGQKDSAMLCYTKSAAQDYTIAGSKDFRYWSALSLIKLGKTKEAKELFQSLVDDGKNSVVEDFINFYGTEGNTGYTVDNINAAAYFTQGLGELGLGHKKKAIKLFGKTLSLDPDNLWAHEMLESLRK